MIAYHNSFHLKPVIDKDLSIIPEYEEFMDRLAQELRTVQGVNDIYFDYMEDSEIKQAINEISKKYGIPRNEVEKIVLNDINKIFI